MEEKIEITIEQFRILHSFIHKVSEAVHPAMITVVMGLGMCPSCPDREDCSAREFMVEKAGEYKDEALAKFMSSNNIPTQPA